MRRLLTAIVLVGLTWSVGAPAEAAVKPIQAAVFTVAVTAPLGEKLDGACATIHNQSQCGNAVATLTLTGFKDYGGIAPCPADGCAGMPIDQFGNIGGRGSARLVQWYQCGSGGPVHAMTAVIPALVEWQGVASGVNSSTRINSNTARVQTTYPFPNPLSYSSCPNETKIIAGLVSGFSVGYSGNDKVAARLFKRPGYFFAS